MATNMESMQQMKKDSSHPTVMHDLIIWMQCQEPETSIITFKKEEATGHGQ